MSLQTFCLSYRIGLCPTTIDVLPSIASCGN